MKELTAFRVDRQVMRGLREVKERDGISLSEQLDRALRAYLKLTRPVSGCDSKKKRV